MNNNLYKILSETSEKTSEENITYTFDSCSKYNSWFKIAPHIEENWGSVEWAKLYTYCHKNNIGVHSYGLLNQLPFLSMVSDKSTVVDMPLDFLFQKTSIGPSLSHFTKDCFFFDGRKDYFGNFYNLPCKEVDLLKVKQISCEELIDEYKSKPAFICQKSYDLFGQLFNSGQISKDLIVSIFKVKGFDNVRNYLSKFTDRYKIRGLKDNFNNNLLKLCRSHFMAIQLLCSIEKGWRYLTTGGASPLMVILPVQCTVMADQPPCFYDEPIRFKSNVQKYQYGYEPLFYIYPYSKSNNERVTSEQLEIYCKAIQSLPDCYFKDMKYD